MKNFQTALFQPAATSAVEEALRDVLGIELKDGEIMFAGLHFQLAALDQQVIDVDVESDPLRDLPLAEFSLSLDVTSSRTSTHRLAAAFVRVVAEEVSFATKLPSIVLLQSFSEVVCVYPGTLGRVLEGDAVDAWLRTRKAKSA